MSEHIAKIKWKNEATDFDYETYDRTHLVEFPGGKVTASSAPEYKGDARFVNPEEMLAAAIASCHMLTFLAVAAKSRLHLLTYSDRAVAHLEKDTDGITRVTRVDLHPKVTFKEDVPAEKQTSMHEKAHRNCFVANSVKCEVRVNELAR